MTRVDSILAAALAPPTADALAVMRLSLLDWLAVGIAGQTEPVAQILRAEALDDGGAPQATLFGGGKVPARMAAMVNGTTSHALDYDDTHFAHIGHPSTVIFPAAFAVAERLGRDLDATLRAALAGAEASVRMGLALGRAHYQVGFHQTATAGAFGACVTASQLLGLAAAQRGHALGLVSTRASGLKSQFGTMGKPWNAGIAAANGVEAALLAARGMVSDPGAWEGQNGFFATHHADGGFDAPEGFLMQGVSHKLHACCHGLHAMLEALATLPKGRETARLDRLEITTHPRWMTVCNKPAPATGLEAKFSYAQAAALALAGHDTAALGTWSDALCADPQVQALRARVTVTAHPDCPETAAHVVAYQGAAQAEARHDLAAPQPLAQRQARVRAKVSALLGADMVSQLSAAIDDNDMPTILQAIARGAVA